MKRQPPANDDSQTLEEYRRQMITDLVNRAPMKASDLDAWNGEVASHLATWILQDGATIQDVRAGKDPSSAASALFVFSDAVARAHHEKRQQLIDGEAKVFFHTLQYPGGQEAAHKNALERFSASLQADGFSGVFLDAVAGLMSRMCLARVGDRLRAEIMATSGTLPGDKPKD